MGLDAYLYSTTPRRRQQLETERQRRKEYNEWANALIDSDKYKGFNDFPHGNGGRIDLDKCSDKQKEQYKKLFRRFKSELKKKAKSLGGFISDELHFSLAVPESEQDLMDKLCYFDRNWELHNFIAENFGDPKNDNLVEIYLDEAAITKILEKFPNPEFRTALSVVKGGGVVFYYAWY